MAQAEMKILALIGSPRKGSNTDILVDCILKGAESRGHNWEKIYLYGCEIFPCIDCRRCKQRDFSCVLKDGMANLYSKLAETDLIIFGTPVYWYGPTAKMKLFIDRLRPFIDSGKLRGKRAVVVAPSEEGASCCGPLMEMFAMSSQYLGLNFCGSVLSKAYERGQIRESPEELKRAFLLGASL